MASETYAIAEKKDLTRFYEGWVCINVFKHYRLKYHGKYHRITKHFPLNDSRLTKCNIYYLHSQYQLILLSVLRRLSHLTFYITNHI